MKLSKDSFDGLLNIADDVVVLDARNEESSGLEKVKRIMKRLRKEITVISDLFTPQKVSCQLPMIMMIF